MSDPILEDWEMRRRLEALLFAATGPLSTAELAEALPAGVDVAAHLSQLAEDYRNRGVQLVQVAGRWQFRTAQDLAFLLRREVDAPKRLSRAATETLAIIAYHQPVTRAEIEEIRGVAVSRGTLDVLMEAGWIKPKGRKAAPGRPQLYVTTDTFLVHFGLDGLDALPGVKELDAAGLLTSVEDALARSIPHGETSAQIDLEDAIDAATRDAGKERE